MQQGRFRIKSKQKLDRHSKSFGHQLQFFKRRGISAAFNETQEIDRHTYHLSEVLLALPQVVTYLENSQPELFSEGVQNSTCNPPKVWRNLIPGTTEPDYGFELDHLGTLPSADDCGELNTKSS